MTYGSKGKTAMGRTDLLGYRMGAERWREVEREMEGGRDTERATEGW